MIHDIDADLCTHIIYAFAVLDSSKLVIKPHDSWADIDNREYDLQSKHPGKTSVNRFSKNLRSIKRLFVFPQNFMRNLSPSKNVASKCC